MLLAATLDLLLSFEDRTASPYAPDLRDLRL